MEASHSSEHAAPADPGEALLHDRRSERAVRREAARAALLGAGVHAAEAGQAPRQPALLPAPRSAPHPPHPRAALRPGLHHQRRAQPPGRARRRSRRSRRARRARTSRRCARKSRASSSSSGTRNACRLCAASNPRITGIPGCASRHGRFPNEPCLSPQCPQRLPGSGRRRGTVPHRLGRQALSGRFGRRGGLLRGSRPPGGRSRRSASRRASSPTRIPRSSRASRPKRSPTG